MTAHPRDLYARVTVARPSGDFEKRYANEPFVDVLPVGSHPERARCGRERCRWRHRPQNGDTVVVLSVTIPRERGIGRRCKYEHHVRFPEKMGLEQLALLPDELWQVPSWRPRAGISAPRMAVRPDVPCICGPLRSRSRSPCLCARVDCFQPYGAARATTNRGGVTRRPAQPGEELEACRAAPESPHAEARADRRRRGATSPCRSRRRVRKRRVGRRYRVFNRYDGAGRREGTLSVNRSACARGPCREWTAYQMLLVQGDSRWRIPGTMQFVLDVQQDGRKSSWSADGR